MQTKGTPLIDTFSGLLEGSGGGYPEALGPPSGGGSRGVKNGTLGRRKEGSITPEGGAFYREIERKRHKTLFFVPSPTPRRGKIY